MNNITPGYYSYVLGEAIPDIAQAKLHQQQPNGQTLYDICYHTFYSFLEHPDQYYHLSWNRFIRAVRQICQENHVPTFNIDSSVMYFYNRQFYIQFVSIPHLLPSQNIHIPIDRMPNNEIQVDIMQLTPDQTTSNFNLGFVVVVLDPFSRFCWAYPTAGIDSARVRKAFFLALSRPGVPYDYSHFLRDKVHRLVVDGGSEFKDSFRGNYKQAFPNATLYISDPKRKTMGRPTNTGPVEAVIGTLRRVLRDHQAGVSPQFLANRQYGLGQALDAYNQMEQSQTIHHSSPQEVAMSAMGKGNAQLIPQLNTYMQNQQQDKIQQKEEMQQHSEIQYDNNSAFRLFIPPGAFSKLVIPRVSKEAYHVTRIRDMYHVDLREINGGNATMQNVNVKQLVLIKTPIEMGPRILMQNIITNVEALRVRHTPREVSLAYNISPEIVRAVGAPQLPDLENQQIDRNPQVRQPRLRHVPRHLEAYHLHER